MKLTLAILLSIFVSGISAQITISNDFLPQPSDSFFITTAADPSQYDFTLTGAAYTWDFSQLDSSNSEYLKYSSIAETPLLFQMIFNPFVSNVAQKRPDVSLFSVELTNGYTYYKNSSQSFKEVGFGTEVNGTPIPVTYKSADVIYEFPLSYQKTYFSFASYSFGIPGYGSLSQERDRQTIVDGYGTVHTPFGSFECLRLSSIVQQTDSVTVDALPIQIPPIPSSYTEYIWLTQDLGVPVLKAVYRMGVATDVTYIDSTDEVINPDDLLPIHVYPNPSNDVVVVETNRDTCSIMISDIRGTIVYSVPTFVGYRARFDVKPLSSGIYIVRIQSGDFLKSKKIIVH